MEGGRGFREGGSQGFLRVKSGLRVFQRGDSERLDREVA